MTVPTTYSCENMALNPAKQLQEIISITEINTDKHVIKYINANSTYVTENDRTYRTK